MAGDVCENNSEKAAPKMACLNLRSNHYLTRGLTLNTAVYKEDFLSSNGDQPDEARQKDKIEKFSNGQEILTLTPARYRCSSQGGLLLTAKNGKDQRRIFHQF